MMKKIYNIFSLPTLLILLFGVIAASCEYQETDFGLNGSINGTIKDDQGNLVYGDVLTNNIVVKLLGEGDNQTIDVRVKGDGTFQNAKIFPKNHKIWVSGPVIFTDTIYNDFSDVINLTKDFVVTPFVSPVINVVTVEGTTLNVVYSITANAGKTVSKSEVYCSTARYPTSAIGSQTGFYWTKTVALSGLAGNVNITGLTSGERYYIRIGSQAKGTSQMNYSNQVVVTIP